MLICARLEFGKCGQGKCQAERQFEGYVILHQRPNMGRSETTLQIRVGDDVNASRLDELGSGLVSARSEMQNFQRNIPLHKPHRTPSRQLTCSATIPNPSKIASGLLNTLIPRPPITPSILPILICRTAFGFGAPDCVIIGVCASCEYVFRRSPSFASGSAESQRIDCA